MAESMDDILNEEAPAAPPEAPAEAPTEALVERPQSRKAAWRDKEQAAQGRVRNPETGQFSQKEEAKQEEVPTEVKEVKEVKTEVKAEPLKQDLTDKERAFLKAAHDERAKRQELERRIAEYEKPKPTAEAKTFWDDPEAALAKHRSEIQAEAERIRAEARNQHLNTTEFMARKAHPDFDAKIEVFAELLKTTPGLHQEWLAQPDPAEFAYSTAKSHIELKEAGSLDQLRAKIEKEVRVKLEAELREKSEALEKERAALPPSLSDARSKGNSKTVWSGPPSMDSILHG